jgi:hypothetical protein
MHNFVQIENKRGKILYKCLNCGIIKQFYKNSVEFVKNELIYYIEPYCNNNDKK